MTELATHGSLQNSRHQKSSPLSAPAWSARGGWQGSVGGVRRGGLGGGRDRKSCKCWKVDTSLTAFTVMTNPIIVYFAYKSLSHMIFISSCWGVKSTKFKYVWQCLFWHWYRVIWKQLCIKYRAIRLLGINYWAIRSLMYYILSCFWGKISILQFENHKNLKCPIFRSVVRAGKKIYS